MADEPFYDFRRSGESQIGIVIIMGRLKLLKQSISFPDIGTGGTFSVVANDRVESVKYELNVIINRDQRTGKYSL